MGIFDRIRDKSSHEEGLECVYNNNRCFARFGVDISGNGNSITSDVEILRGELAGILFDVTKDDVSYIFGDMIESLEETDNQVTVHFSNGTPTTVFDLVVGADGIGSKTRRIALGMGPLISDLCTLTCRTSPFHPAIQTRCGREFTGPREVGIYCCDQITWAGPGHSSLLQPTIGQTEDLLDLKRLQKRVSQHKRLWSKSFSKTPAGKFRGY